jgi:hypothetical protein
MRQLKQGDILTAHWGWEQTNVNFYLVNRVTAKTVWIQRIEAIETPDSNPQAMRGTSVPNVSKVCGKEMRRKIQFNTSDEPGCGINNYKYARLWDGTPQAYTSYG